MKELRKPKIQETIGESENDWKMADKRYTNGKSTSESMERRKKAHRDAQNVGTGKSSFWSVDAVPKKRRNRKKHPIIVEDTSGEFPSIPSPLCLQTEESLISPGHSLDAFVPCHIPKVNESGDDPEETRELENVEIVVVKQDVALRSIPEESSSMTSSEPQDSKEERHRQEDSATDAAISAENETSADRLPRFYNLGSKVLVIMETDWKFSFHGKLKIRVLWGTIRIYGYSINAPKTKLPLKIYSPRAYSPLAIEVIDGEILDKDLSLLGKTLEKECGDRKIATRLQSETSAIEEGWAILILESFDDQLTNFLSINFPHRLFPRIRDLSNYSWCDPRRAEVALQSHLYFDDTSNRRIVIDSRGIDDVADAIRYDWETKRHSRTVIAGGKGVGKSTMARYLVNKLLATSDAVIFLDLDPGQAEFTPAGCISLTIVSEPLLGPNFTHLRTPYFQIYIGGPDVTRYLERYVNGVERLIDRLNDDARLAHRPVVVNTMGFCKGIGWNIALHVIKTLWPTDLIQILSKRSKNNFEDTLSRRVIDQQNLGWMTCKKVVRRKEKPARHRLHVIYSEAETSTGPAESWALEAHQQRELVMISYLSKIAEMSESASFLSREISSNIRATPPYTIPFSAITVSLVGAFVPRVLSVMNGNIVALCGVDLESSEKSDEAAEENTSEFYPRVLVRPPLCTCYGFGILRGVDMEKKELFINAPLPPARMRNVNCLVGSTNIPRSLLQLEEQWGGSAPYTGNYCDLPTSREPRRGYPRTRYQGDN